MKQTRALVAVKCIHRFRDVLISPREPSAYILDFAFRDVGKTPSFSRFFQLGRSGSFSKSVSQKAYVSEADSGPLAREAIT